ncbi:MAG: hypothetical protein ACI8XO_003067 [Verrucomicrobiales bacterium]|jgi:hypothetical protein
MFTLMNHPSRLVVVAALVFTSLVGEIAAGESSASPLSGKERDPHVLFGETRWILDGRLRYEHAEQSGRGASDALTWRHRAGIQTGELAGLSALVELEHTLDLLGEDQGNPFPRPGRTVIADPENFELNRLQFDYRPDIWGSTLTVGRQRITLDDQRFIGNVGWRQNEQTYDAVRLQAKPSELFTLNYAYLARVNRIFGEQAPSPRLNHLDSDSHLVNLKAGPLSVFAYLLDFEDAAALSSQTYGARLNGSFPSAGSTSLVFDLQWAIQQDYAGNPNDYRAQFYRIEGGVDLDNSVQVGLGYERLGEDAGAAFQAPLGTNHKFNGFADGFLSTPTSGLQDLYAYVGAKLPAGFSSRLGYHHFLTDTDSDSLGDELDFTIGHKLGENASALLKAAHLEGDGGQADIQRLSLQIDYKF